jgi:hypothetical protein
MSPSAQPLLHQHAVENLRFIRDTTGPFDMSPADVFILSDTKFTSM